MTTIMVIEVLNLIGGEWLNARESLEKAMARANKLWEESSGQKKARDLLDVVKF